MTCMPSLPRQTKLALTSLLGERGVPLRLSYGASAFGRSCSLPPTGQGEWPNTHLYSPWREDSYRPWPITLHSTSQERDLPRCLRPRAASLRYQADPCLRAPGSKEPPSGVFKNQTNQTKPNQTKPNQQPTWTKWPKRPAWKNRPM